MDSASLGKVLVVDDEKDIRDTTATFLANIGYAVSCAASGDEALQMVETDPSLTLLLTDIEIPGRFHGFALARRAKAIRPDLRVIYITGYSDLSRFDLSAVHGPIVRKPFRLVHLAGEIDRVLAQAEASLVTARESEAKALHELEEMRLQAARQREDYVRLQASADLAAAMNLAKSRLLTTVGHDLRQPLTVLVGTLELLAGRVDAAGQKKMVARAEVAAHRLTDGIDSILEGARLAFTGIEPKVKPFPIASVLTLLRDAHESEARAKALTLRLHAPSAVVVSDPALLTSVFDNLIGNAIKYTERGGVLVGCRRHRDKLVVQVWDTGIGIAPNSVKAIFEEYRRVAPAGRPGFGLGLAIVKQTCDRLGHAVAVRSVPGKGSCFSIELPLAAAPTLVPGRRLA
jgi:signal transduction histidine kinase